MEWFPAPPNTSATFLNQKDGPMLAAGDKDEAVGRHGEDRRISQLYSLSAASEEEESDSSHRERKARVIWTWREENSRSRSPQRGERRERRRDSDSKRRASFEENKTRRLSSSSAELESYRRSSFQSEYSVNSGSTSRPPETRRRHDSSTRSSLDSGRYENKDRREADGAVEEESRTSDPGQNKIPDGAGSYNGQSDGGSKKSLPPNLLDIFNQIAQFEKEKGLKPKK